MSPSPSALSRITNSIVPSCSRGSARSVSVPFHFMATVRLARLGEMPSTTVVPVVPRAYSRTAPSGNVTLTIWNLLGPPELAGFGLLSRVKRRSLALGIDRNRVKQARLAGIGQRPAFQDPVETALAPGVTGRPP